MTHSNLQLQSANDEIRANLQQALRNQSVYLTGESRRLLEEGDRMGAICLALEALPLEERPRPYVPRAMEALADAVYAYEPMERIAVDGAYKVDGIARKFAVTDDR